MSIPKKFYELQDMILLRTSLEKVKRHVEERKEATLFKWVDRELTEFHRKGAKFGCAEEEREIVNAIKNEDWGELQKNIEKCLNSLKKEIEKVYSDMSNSNVNV
ncbi:hypothetical protein GWK48_04015 [Metallosphaera tengchongensis]|uniref:Uncharacterized protein n=1 Tax=Metallosphaera tengchongensis TaxID=1532350 RepID=A0A6N0NWD9_9CREN|nr:hypothetical protein [Metallosphaera tengchongensis]QKQ99667.1 hypothetical protein GWK48_04015 [Metallosphaera tengchongensis]